MAARGGMERLEATIVKSGLLKTNAKHRPSPSLFYMPGLTSRPFWNSRHFSWAQTCVGSRSACLVSACCLILPFDYRLTPYCDQIHSLEAEAATIKREYLALREAKMASDYRADTEHSLHKGKWE